MLVLFISILIGVVAALLFKRFYLDNLGFINFKKEHHYKQIKLGFKKQKENTGLIKISYDEFNRLYSLTPDAFEFVVESEPHYYLPCEYFFKIKYTKYTCDKWVPHNARYCYLIPENEADLAKFIHLAYIAELTYKEQTRNLAKSTFLEDYRDRLSVELDLADQKIEEAKKNILDIQNRL